MRSRVTKVIKCDPIAPQPEVIAEVVRVLENKGAVVFPTETQYGLGLRADGDDVLENVCRIKKRDSKLLPALFVKDIEMAEQFCIVNEDARLLADKFLPGPLTLVLPAREDQSAVNADLASDDGFGIRISSSPFVRACMRSTGFPVTATSANESGRVTPSTVAEIKEYLGDSVNLYIDGGVNRGIVPSTVVRVSDSVDVLRHGAIPEVEIRRTLQEGTK